MATNDILAALQDPLYKPADTFSGIAAGGLATALPQLVDPYGSSTTNALNVFGGSILAALLGRMAKNDASDENADVVTKQAAFLAADPSGRLAMAQEDPRTFAKLQTALETNDLIQQAQDKSTLRQLEIAAPFKTGENKAALENQIQAQIDPRIIKARAAEAAATRANADFDNARNLANDFATHAAVADYKYKENNMKALSEAIKDPTGTSDFEIIRRAAQMVEPKLAVRQDDQDSLQGAASVLGMTTAKIQSIISGQSKLDTPTRAGLLRIGQRAFDASTDNYNVIRQNFLNRASTAGFDPAAIVPYDYALPFNKIYPSLAAKIALPGQKIAAPAAVIQTPAAVSTPAPSVIIPPQISTNPPSAPDPGMKWQHNADFTQWRQVPNG